MQIYPSQRGQLFSFEPVALQRGLAALEPPRGNEIISNSSCDHSGNLTVVWLLIEISVFTICGMASVP